MTPIDQAMPLRGADTAIEAAAACVRLARAAQLAHEGCSQDEVGAELGRLEAVTLVETLLINVANAPQAICVPILLAMPPEYLKRLAEGLLVWAADIANIARTEASEFHPEGDS